MAAPIRFLSGRNQQQKIGIEGSTENQKVLEVVGQVGIGTTIFEPSAELEVRGDVLVSGILTVGSITIGSGGGGTFQVDNLDVSGISTFTGAIDANGDLDVDGHTELDDVNISGVSTFAGAIDANGDLDVDGHTELDDVNISGVSTFAGAIDANGDLDVDGHTELDNLNVSGLSTFTGAIDANGDLDVDGHTELDNLNVSGLSTFTGAIDANGDLDVDGHTELDDVNISGVSTFAGAIDANGDLDVDGHTELDDVNVSGAITATTFTGNLTGNADTATSLATARTFELTGDVVASQISFDGTGNVSLAATIQPNSVALGGDTTGDYVESVSGTANEIEVTGGTGEGSAPTIGFVANPTIGGNVNIGQDLTVTRDLKVTRNLNVDGTVTIGGTSATIFAETLKISDPDIILGVRTDAGGNDISNDTTANHGGVALASTEGSPLITLINPGAGETLPSTYKKIMWFKTNSFTGLNTDAWLTNYAFGVGTTSMSAGTKFAVGNIEADFDDITSVRHINSTGVGTFTTLDIGTGGIDVDGHTELDNLNVSGASTFTGSADFNGDIDVDGHAELDNVNISGVTTASNTTIGFGNTEFIVDGDARITGVITANRIYSEVFGEFTGSSVVSDSLVGTALSISGISTLGTVQISSGIVTATSGVVTYYGDGSNLVDLTGASAGTYGDSSSTAVIQVDSDGRITGIATTNIDGLSEISADTTPQLGGDLDLNGNDITGTGNINITGVVTATSFDGSIDFSKVTGVTTDISADTTPQLGGDLDLNGNFITGSGGINITGVVTATSFEGDGSNLTGIDVVDDTTPQLGGDLDLNGNFITGSGGINVTGVVTATTFSGNVTSATYATTAGISTYATTAGIATNATTAGTATTATNIDISATSSGDTTTHVVLVGNNVTGGQQPFIDNGSLTYNASTNVLSAGGFNGDGSSLTALNASQLTSGTIPGDRGVTSGSTSSSFVEYNGTTATSGQFDGGTTTPSGTTRLNYGGYLYATRFYGDGSNLTGIDVVDDTTPQLGGDLDLNGNFITGSGGINVTGVVTATSFDGSIDFSKVTGVTTEISADTTPQLGGDLDLNGNDITGTGNINITGIATFSGNVTIGGTLTYEDVTNIDSVGLITARSGIIVNSGGINVSAGIVTAPAFTGFDYLQAPHGTTVNYSVTIASKTAAHRYNGSGSSDGYVINGVESPFLTFTPGRTYRFTLSSGDMSSHPFRFYLEADKTTQYTTNVTSTSTYTEIVVTDITPIVLHYQCSAHDYMGNAAQTNSNKLNTPYQIDGLKGANITGVVTASSIHTTSNVGVGTTTANGAADSNNTTILNAGIVTANFYYGDGSNLTGLTNASSSSGEFFTGITSSRQIAPLSYETSVFTFPSTAGKQYVIESINVANVDASVGVGTTVNIIASIQDATAGEQTYIAYNVPIVNGGLIELLKNPIVAGPSDVIKMWSTNDAYVGVNNATEVYMSYSEFESTDYISKFASTVSIATTDLTAVYTSSTYPSVIESIHLANRTDVGDYPVSVVITNGLTTTYLAKDLLIPRYSTVDILDRPKRVELNGTIGIKVGQTSTIDVIIAGKQITS